MENHLTIRLPKRLLKVALILTIVGAVIAPIAVSASHQFTDVPTDNIFHDNIGWLADNNVTLGCNPPTNDQFCPDANVTRGQMAAFMQRLSEGKIVDAATAVTADSAATAATADSATEADDADTVDGKQAAAFLTYGSSVPAFSTLTGAFAMGGTAAAAGALAETDISFAIPMPGDLEGHIINVGDPVPTGCSGSAVNPGADAGHLCIFAGYNSEGGPLAGFYRPDTGANDGSVSPFGAVVGLFSANAGQFEASGTWAATAPLSLIVIPLSEAQTEGFGS